jgi:hypothetical protein
MENDYRRSSEEALAESIGLHALVGIGKEGLHALAVRMDDRDVCELIIVPEHPATIEDILHWEHHTGEVRLLFHGEADIHLRIMDIDEFHNMEKSNQPSYNANLADA